MPENLRKTSSYTDDVLGQFDAVELARLIAGGEISAREAVAAAIARAEGINPIINAIATDTYLQALEDADTAVAGPFAGVPTFVKDTDKVRGVPTLMGSRALPETPARKSSSFVKHYSSLGFISLGKSKLCEFGLTATTEPLLGGPARNPWHLDHSTGGSSGGSAALVAAGVVPIAHANDGGGSIRIPAASCGLVGLKATRGRLPAPDGSAIAPVKIVHQGMLSRSVRDTCAFYAASEQHFHNPSLPEIGKVSTPLGRRLKIGFFDSGLDGAACDEETTAAVHVAAGLCERLGHAVAEIDCPYSSQTGHDFTTYWGMMAFYLKNFGRVTLGKGFDRSRLEELTINLSGYFRRQMLSAPMIIARLRGFAKTYASIFERYDVLLSPVFGRVPPRLGELGPERPFDEVMAQFHQYYCYTPPQNISGAPAISLPLARRGDGLPIGLQFAAAFGQDRLLLELALELEQAQPWPLLTSHGSHHPRGIEL